MLKVPSKIFEKVTLKQFSGFLNLTGRLSFEQSGNEKYHSTETLSILVNDLLLKSMDNKKLTTLVLLDLSKAFDSVDHSILSKQLSNIGFQVKPLAGLKATFQIESSSFALAPRYPKFYQSPTECFREQYCHLYCSASI